MTKTTYNQLFIKWATHLNAIDTEANKHILAFAGALEYTTCKLNSFEPGSRNSDLTIEAVDAFLLRENITYRAGLMLFPESVLHVMMTQFTDATVFDDIARSYAYKVLKLRKAADLKRFADDVMHMMLLFLDVTT